MNIIEAIILGAVQGLTEFIPVSSSGHMLVIRELFGFQSSFELETLLNVGTLLAAIIYFRSELAGAFKSMFTPAQDSRPRLAWLLVVATLPLLVAGVAFDLWLADMLRSNSVAILMLISIGVLMIAVKAGNKRISQLRIPDGILIGLSQIVALVPGSSRSGVTMLAGMKLGLSAEAAARFSFLLSVPAVGAAVVYTALSVVAEGSTLSQSLVPLLIGNLVSFLAALLAIHGMITFLKRSGLASFGWYRLALGLILLITL